MNEQAAAVEIYSGCPFYVDVPADGFLYLKLKRTESRSRWQMVSEAMDPDTISSEGLPPQDRHIVWYDFHAMPWYNDGESINHAYHYMSGVDYERVVERDDDAHNDAYHQDSAGHWLLETAADIPEAQLQFLYDLYYDCCFPTQTHTPIFDPFATDVLNKHWTRANHMSGYYQTGQNAHEDYNYRDVYNTSGSESDPDTVPFCDWMFTKGLNETTGEWSDPTIGRTACDDFDYVSCDAQGNIVELGLASHAFSGSVPASIANLLHLQKLDLSYNQLTGELPAAVFASTLLEEAYVTHNHLTGDIPCMTHPEPRLTTISLSQNSFTGGLKPCLFTEAPLLQNLYISYNSLNSTIPPEVMEATELQQLSAIHAGLRGELPREMMCLKKLSDLHLQRNQLTGTLEQVVTNGWRRIYGLDLSDNLLSGQLPTFDWHTPALRFLTLSDNLFTAPVEVQLLSFLEQQDAFSASGLTLDGNRLSGPLPDVFYRLLADGFGMGSFSAARNFMLCDPETGEWPEWVFRFGTTYFGKCMSLATPTAASDMALGKYIKVTGRNFAASDEIKCRLDGLGNECTLAASTSSNQADCDANGGLWSTQVPVSIVLPAVFLSATSVLCGPLAPNYDPAAAWTAYLDSRFTVGQRYNITVANYGSDFYSAALAGSSYAPIIQVSPDGEGDTQTLHAALADLNSVMVAGKPVLLSLSAGHYQLSNTVLNANVLASDVILAGVASEAVQLAGGDAVMLAVRSGAPSVRLQRLQLSGQLAVDGGDLALSNCSFGASPAMERRRLSGATVPRALTIGNGTVALDGVVFEGLGGGAIEVNGGTLTLTGGALRRNSAAKGGAMLVTGGEVRIAGSVLESNTASEGGGALFVEGGSVVLGNQTAMRGNDAPKSAGKAIYSAVELEYELPAPLATWAPPAG